ncbi:MAG: hypothetical protein M3Z09_04325, partial [Acidobacteriota bacterium]|nr:hypothetical protein [Acidobacteriota bacterium]
MTRLGMALVPLILFCPVKGLAQAETALEKMASRLDQMEADNRKLTEELQALRKELAGYRRSAAAAEPSVSERLEVQEQRSAELAQTKVEASQKFPLSVTGMLLFNAFHNGRSNGTSQDPVVAPRAPVASFSGASLRQTVLGLTFEGPGLPGGGKATGSLYMDFAAGSALSEDHLLHLRVATLDLNWRNTSVSIGQDKPIVAPREPDSLAQVAISPLTGAGNLWNWEPQVRVERRFSAGENSGFRAQGGVYQTYELDSSVPGQYASTLERVRPGYEGRLEFWRRSGARRFEIAPGFHESSTHVAGTSVPSQAFTLDWLVRPAAAVQITGAWYKGENLSSLGTLRQGFTILSTGRAIPVHSVGGWAQIALFPASRVSFHIYGGENRDRRQDLLFGGIPWNASYA